MAVDHYENFPVASFLLPARLRPAVRNIYRFARTADDIADEGNASRQERQKELERYRLAVRHLGAGNPASDLDPDLQSVFVPLAETMRDHDLPADPFLDLLSAFSQDVVQTRYADDEALLDYCRRSANPVGLLMLHLYDAVRPELVALSDAICTGLQLTNFWQDVAIDWQKDRIYIPQDALRHHNVDEALIARACQGQQDLARQEAWQSLMAERVQHARQLLLTGLPLGKKLNGRIAFELRMVVHGGLRILERLDLLHYDVFQRRPTLGKADWLRLFWRAR